MATDSTHVSQAGNSANGDQQDFNPEVVQLAQASGAPASGASQNVIPAAPGGTVQVVFPEGQNIVRVQMAPGETVSLPFDGDLAAKFGQEGNLAIQLDGRTIILLGYAESNQQEGITLHNAKGEDVDVAAVIAQTDPNLDIQTAAGGAAAGGSAGSGLFEQFENGLGVGGLGELNVLGQTELQYGLIDPDHGILPAGDTQASLISVTFDGNNGAVNEDDLTFVREGQDGQEGPVPLFAQPAFLDAFLSELQGTDPTHDWTYAHSQGMGNDPYDQTDHEDGSQSNGALSDTGNLDQDREPLTARATLNVNFGIDVPGKVTLSNGGVTPIVTQLQALHLESHGHELQYVLVPAVAGPGGHGEMVVGYYVDENNAAKVVFTVGIEEASGATEVSQFHIDFTIYGVIDNTGAYSDVLNLNVPFYMTDLDGPAVANSSLNFQFVDDTPSFGHVNYEDGIAQNIVEANLTIGHDETPGQQHTTYSSDLQGPTQQTDDNGHNKAHQIEHHIDQVLDQIAQNTASGDQVDVSYQQSILSKLSFEFLNNGNFHADALGAASTKLDASFGADGAADGKNTISGQTIFDHDGAANSQAFELFMKGSTSAESPEGTAQSVTDGAATNLKIDYIAEDGTVIELTVRAYQLDANTIIGIADPADVNGDGVPDQVQVDLASVRGEGGEGDGLNGTGSGVPVFLLTLDPETGQLEFVQYHQIHNNNPDADNDVVHLTNADGEPLVFGQATDYDGDKTQAQLEVSIIDDAPKITCINYCSDGTFDNSKGYVDEDYLSKGNHDKDTSPDNWNLGYGQGPNNGGNNGDGPGDTHVAGQIQVQSVDKPLSFGFNIAGLSLGNPLDSFTDSKGNEVTSHGHAVSLTLTQDGDNWVVTGTDSETHQTVFTVTLDSKDGSFDFDLKGALDHPDNGTQDDNGTTRYEDNLNLDFGVVVNDVEGDKATGTLTFVVDDDAPVARISLTECVNVSVDETPFPQLDSNDQWGPVPSVFDGLSTHAALGWAKSSVAIYTTSGTSYGADGAGSTVITLQTNDGVDSGVKTTDGQTIYLYQQGDLVVGKTAGGEVAFALSLDANTGKLSVVQYLSLDNPNTHDPDDSISLLNGALQISMKVTDGDGDAVTKTIDIGHVVSFQDDGPKATICVVDHGGVTIDETAGHQNDDQYGPVPSVFNSVDDHGYPMGWAKSDGPVVSWSASYGADGKGGDKLSLGIAYNGVDSGLTTTDGHHIYLYLENGLVVGREGNSNGNAAFALSLDSNGKLTVVQYEPIHNSNPNDPDDAVHIKDSALQVTYNVTDGDGDKDSQTVNIGNSVTFDDDGPKATICVVDRGGITIDETAGIQNDDQYGSVPSIFNQVNHHDNPMGWAKSDGPVVSTSVDFGADGKGSEKLSLGISQNGVDSGLTTTDGHQIRLYLENGLVVGREDNSQGKAAFALSLDSNGKLTVVQYEPIHNSNPNDPDDSVHIKDSALQVTYSVTDGDGDKASDTVNIGNSVTFEDDGPTLTVTSNGRDVTIDETAGAQSGTNDHNGGGNPFQGIINGTPKEWGTSNGSLVNVTAVFGADGPASSHSLTYGLNVTNSTSGLHDTATGKSIILSELSDGTVVGKLQGSGEVAFAIKVNSDGSVTVAEYRAIEHDNTHDANDSESLNNNTLSLTVTATDGDGDKVTKSVDISCNVIFKDDGPCVTLSVSNDDNKVLLTHDAETIGNNSDSSTASFGLLFTASPSYGADGAGNTAINYALTLLKSPGADSGLNSNGQDIHLYNINGVIVGSTANSANGVGSSNTVFTLSVNSSTGQVTLTQQQEIDHSGPGSSSNYDNQLATLANGLVGLTGTATTTDGDGDKATDSKTIDLGGNVSFADDGPCVTLSVSNDSNKVLLTHDAETIGNNSDSATASFGSLFTATPSYGADGAGNTAINYALTLLKSPGADSGLNSNGQDIHLYNINGVIVGSTANSANGVGSSNTVFTLSVNSSTGQVTLTQQQEIDHSGPGSSSNYDNQLATLANGLVGLTGTATTTDGDGDKATDSKTIDLGGNVSFADDGPCVTLSVSNDDNKVLLTHDAETIGNNSDSSTASFGLLFTASPSYGADGAGNTAINYALTLLKSPGADSGLNSNGQDIHLYNINGVIVGSTANSANGVGSSNTVFTLSVNSSTGQVTLTQQQEIDHSGPGSSSNYDNQLATLANGLVGLTGTATTTDGDGDKATDSKTIDLGGNVSFADDGPSVTLSLSNDGNKVLLTHDAETIGNDSDTATTSFKSLFTATPTYGADGPGNTSVAFALTLLKPQGADSGLNSNGQDIHLYSINGAIVGSTANSANGVNSGNTVFKLTVDSDGDVTLTQYQEIDHKLPGSSSDYDDQVASLADGLVGLTGTATTTDGDGDKATDSKTIDLGGNVSFADDGPCVTLSVSNDSNKVLLTHDAETIGNNSDSATASFGSLFTATPTYGADGSGNTSVAFALTLLKSPGADSGLNSNGQDIHLYNINGVIVGSTANSANGVGSGNTVFTLSVNSGTGQVTLTQQQEIDHSGPGSSSNYDNQLATLANGLVGLTGTATTTDGDGDKATDSKTIDLGGNVSFADDGPKATNFSVGAFAEHSGQHDLGTVESVFGGHYVTGADTPGTIVIPATADNTHGTLSIIGDHVYYTPPANVTGNQSFDFNYQVIDADGDISNGKVTVGVTDNVPTITQLTPEGTPGEVTVYEANLSDGSNQNAAALTASGTFKIDTHGEGLGSLLIGGQPVNLVGGFPQTVVSDSLGTLTVTGITHNPDGTDTVAYSYTLTNNHLTSPSADNSNDTYSPPSFSVNATDASGDPATSSLTIHVVDDVPHAADNAFGGFTAQAAAAEVIGNILGNDKSGADGYAVSAITGVQGGVSDGNGGFTITNASGTIHVSSTGDVTFDSNAGHSYGSGESFGFDYTIADKDGDTSTAHASFTVANPEQPTPPAASDLEVNESQLASGNQLGGGSITGSDSFTLPAGYTVQAADLGDHTLPNGTLNISVSGSTVTYTYTLTSPVDDGLAGGADGQNIVDNANTYTVHLDGPFNQTVNVPVNIDIKDDVPVPTADLFGAFPAQVAAGQIIGNILDNDHAGADGYASQKIFSVEGGVSDGNGGFTITNANGTIHVSANGAVTFDSQASHSYGSGESFSFDYAIIDKDGDHNNALATFTIGNPTTPTPPAPSDLAVNESQLASGNHLGGGSITGSNSFTLPTGYTVQAADLGDHTLTNGTLNISVSGSTVTYTYTLTSPVNDGTTAASDDQNVVDNANTYTVHLDGPFNQTVNVPVNIDIKDDVPVATADLFGAFTAQVAAGQVIGNILDNDHAGADGYASQKITSVEGGVSDGNGGFTITSANGTIHVSANGAVTFDSNSGHSYGSGESFGFDYTIADKDGDTSTVHANFTVGNPGTPTPPAPSDLAVNESQLASGNHLGGGSTTANTTFTLPSGYTLDPADIGVHALSNGTLTVAVSGSTVSYSYQLTSPVNDGTTASSDDQNVVDNANTYTLHLDGPFGQTVDVPVHIDIKDDVPVATADLFGAFTAQVAAGQVIGNILDNDHAGADGYASQKITSVAGGVSDGNGGFTITNANGTIHVSANGAVTFDSKSGHSYGSGENISFNYTIQDKDGDTSTATASMTVKGGQVPINYNDAVTVTEPTTTKNNVLIMLDCSQSMLDTVPGSSQNRLELAKAAIIDLLNKYDANGDVSVMIEGFRGNSQQMSSWSSVAAAIAYVNNLDPSDFSSSGTNYHAAITAGTSILNAPTGGTYIAGAPTSVYFMSDGEPTTGSLTTTEKNNWNTALENHADHVYSVGMGSDIPVTNTDLSDVAFPDRTGGNPQGDNTPAGQVLHVVDFNDLSAQLQNTVATPVSGNVLDGSIASGAGGDPAAADVAGTGANHIAFMQYKGVTFTWDGNTAHQVVITNAASGQVTSNANGVVTFKTDYGTMTFYFQPSGSHVAGDFTFTPNSVDADKTETFHYYTQDSLNQTETATPQSNPGGADLVITIKNVNPPVNTVPGPVTTVASYDKVITGLSVHDVDNQNLTVTLHVDHGIMTLASTAGISFTDAQGDDTMTFSGSEAAVNAALAGLHYVATDHYGGADTLTITSKDPTNLTDTDTVAINVIDNDVTVLTNGHSTYTGGNTTTLDSGDFPGNNTSHTESGSTGHHIVDGATTDNSGSHTITGTSGNDWIEGGNGDDTLNGGNGNDYLQGDAGFDKYSGGAGNDVIKADAADLQNTGRSIDGGTGDDLLDLSGIGSTTWNFAASNSASGGHAGIANIEQFSLNGGGNNSVTLDAQSVLDMTDARHTLVIQGDAGDSVGLSNAGATWTKVGDNVDGHDGNHYNVYVATISGNQTTVFVDHDITTTVS